MNLVMAAVNFVNDDEQLSIAEIKMCPIVLHHASVDVGTTDLLDVENRRNVIMIVLMSLTAERNTCRSLHKCWDLASQNTGNLFCG
jgi:hypothetical protein